MQRTKARWFDEMFPFRGLALSFLGPALPSLNHDSLTIASSYLFDPKHISKGQAHARINISSLRR